MGASIAPQVFFAIEGLICDIPCVLKEKIIGSQIEDCRPNCRPAYFSNAQATFFNVILYLREDDYKVLLTFLCFELSQDFFNLSLSCIGDVFTAFSFPLTRFEILFIQPLHALQSINLFLQNLRLITVLDVLHENLGQDSRVVIEHNYVGFLALISQPGSSFTKVVQLTILSQLIFGKILIGSLVRLYKIAI